VAAAESSFDIVSRVDMMELKNAVSQAEKELSNRYDLKSTKAEIQFEKDELTLVADDDFVMDQLESIIFSKLLKRGIDARQISWSKREPAAGITIKQKLELKVGIPQDQAKALTKQIRDAIKVNAQIQGDEVRVSSKSRDDLQKAIAFVKGLELDYPVDFVNYR
jgi:uncharacterized protein YajQ (UPF0234 family)